jgi:hypothetical protein
MACHDEFPPTDGSRHERRGTRSTDSSSQRGSYLSARPKQFPGYRLVSPLVALPQGDVQLSEYFTSPRGPGVKKLKIEFEDIDK